MAEDCISHVHTESLRKISGAYTKNRAKAFVVARPRTGVTFFKPTALSPTMGGVLQRKEGESEVQLGRTASARSVVPPPRSARVAERLHNRVMHSTFSPARPSALIDFHSPENRCKPLHLAFGQPTRQLCAYELGEVTDVIQQADALSRSGAWCVGHVSYEAAPAFDRALRTHRPGGTTEALARFYVYDQLLEDEAAEQAWELGTAANASVHWAEGLQRSEFDSAITAIQRAITNGELYQVNFTSPLNGSFEGDPLVLFDRLRAAQPLSYAAYIADLDNTAAVLSVSPELFFDWREGRLLCSPMKGTAPRGGTPPQDEALRQALLSSPKERAENVMIVDLLRNDMSRIAEPHSVSVRHLFQAQAWPTVWQLTSDIEARTRSGVALLDVFKALFPCGSVTGAPKVRAMTQILALEPEPRGVYCGAIGVLQPGGAATFNVPIRTLMLRGNRVHCGVGSGITSDARADDEWAEWRHKRMFAERASEPFELLETLRLSDGSLIHVDQHLARMKASAQHFGFAWESTAIEHAIRDLSAQHPNGEWRVRLLSDRAGRVQAQAYAIETSPAEVVVQLATRAIRQSDGEFFRHKTTRRAHYDAFAPSATGVFDTLLWNERGELTEFTRGNVALQIDGEWLTPALNCGLLAGVARGRLLEAGRLRETVLTTGDLERTQEVAFFNSLRGWILAKVI